MVILLVNKAKLMQSAHTVGAFFVMRFFYSCSIPPVANNFSVAVLSKSGNAIPRTPLNQADGRCG
jgi:hypothetical protein